MYTLDIIYTLELYRKSVISVFLLACAIWVGAIVFHSAIVAPSVFATLDEPGARSLLRTLFPRFFRLGLVCGGIMAFVLVLVAGFSEWTPVLVFLAALTALMIVFEGVSLWLVPRINAARDAGDAGAARFASLHRLSVMLTLAILLAGIAVLITVGLSADFGVER